jgi:hypothetical protein
LNNNAVGAAEQRARDPGNRQQRDAENRLAEALAYVAEALDEVTQHTEERASIQRARQRDWSVIQHSNDFWVLPITAAARGLAAAIIPLGTPRYGMHYILPADDPVSQAVIESIQESQNA